MSVHPARLSQYRSAKYEIEIAAPAAPILMLDGTSYRPTGMIANRFGTTRSEIVCWVMFRTGTERSSIRYSGERSDSLRD
jgi:hypothetical protein